MTNTNPIFNANRMKIGTFCTNGTSALSTIPEAYVATWPGTVEAARLADQAGFEAIVSYARWKGYDPEDPHNVSGLTLEPFTWAAGLAQATSYSSVFATSHSATMHPILAAKQGITIDHISGGRFGLNVVGGWNKHELEMFGEELMPHDQRYDHLTEWTGIIKRLWIENQEFDLDGEYFNVNQAMVMPGPVQKPRPAIMNAGGSPRGKRFACEHADMCFVVLQTEDPDQIREQVESYKTLAREEFGREVMVWTNAFVVQDDDQEAAERYLHKFAVEYEDTAVVEAWLRSQAEQAQLMSPEALAAFRKRFVAGGGSFPLIGTPERINDRLKMLSDCGIDGVVLMMLNFLDSLPPFIRDVLPLMERDGLRAPFNPADSGASNGDKTLVGAG